ncbi:hypothetical protein Tco_0519016 [Tanacetum coccineum]
MNRQLLDSHGLIPGMTSTQALKTIQTMVDHSQKWHDGTSSRNLSSSNTNGLVAIIRPHLEKECPLNEEVKQLGKVKYGEFRRSAPFNESNRAKFRVGPLRYYTRTDTRPPYEEKKPGLEELTKINTRNQSASLKNLETKIEQLTKELHARTTNGTPSSSAGQCKVVSNDHETQHRHISSRKLNDKEEWMTKDIQCQLPPKELNPRNFTLPCTIGNFNFYGTADLGASVNIMPRNTVKYLRLANLRNTNMLVEMADMTKKAPLDVHRDSTYWWHDHGFEKEERNDMGIEIEKFDPPEVQVETFKVRKYSFKGGQKFVWVTKEVNDALPIERRNSLAIPMFQQGEDPIECINKVMTFLSPVASRFPPSNNQLRTSSNPRNQATIQDVPGILEAPVAQQTIPQNLAFQAEDLDAYDSDYDDLSLAKSVLMANLSSCDLEVLSESQDAVIQDTNSSTPNDLLVLSLVEQMTDHVAHLDKENQINKMRIQPTLYDGSVIAKEHAVISMIDDEETLILEEESRSKMLDKQNDPISIEKKIKISPIDCSKLN